MFYRVKILAIYIFHHASNSTEVELFLKQYDSYLIGWKRKPRYLLFKPIEII